MHVHERKQYILEIIRNNKLAIVSNLSADLNTSEVTIRRDLKELEAQGLLVRTRGGALKKASSSYEPQISDLAKENIGKKSAIAKKAYDMIKQGDSVVIDSSTTGTQLAKYLKAGNKKATVVTNSFTTIMELMDAPHIEVIHIGGLLRRNVCSSVGSIAENTLMSLRVDKAFIGVNGIDFDAGFTTPNMFESSIKQAMMKIAPEIYIIADSSKFNQVYLSVVCPIDFVDAIITDQDTQSELIQKANERNIRLIIAE